MSLRIINVQRPILSVLDSVKCFFPHIFFYKKVLRQEKTLQFASTTVTRSTEQKGVTFQRNSCYVTYCVIVSVTSIGSGNF